MQFQPFLNETTYQKVKGRNLYFNSISKVIKTQGLLIYEFINSVLCVSLLSFRDIFVSVHFAHISGIINPEAAVPQGAGDVMD